METVLLVTDTSNSLASVGLVHLKRRSWTFLRFIPQESNRAASCLDAGMKKSHLLVKQNEFRRRAQNLGAM